jgi:hypothetical protein
MRYTSPVLQVRRFILSSRKSSSTQFKSDIRDCLLKHSGAVPLALSAPGDMFIPLSLRAMCAVNAEMKNSCKFAVPWGLHPILTQGFENVLIQAVLWILRSHLHRQLSQRPFPLSMSCAVGLSVEQRVCDATPAGRTLKEMHHGEYSLTPSYVFTDFSRHLPPLPGVHISFYPECKICHACFENSHELCVNLLAYFSRKKMEHYTKLYINMSLQNSCNIIISSEWLCSWTSSIARNTKY